jgi:hypothetical protein
LSVKNHGGQSRERLWPYMGGLNALAASQTMFVSF